MFAFADDMTAITRYPKVPMVEECVETSSAMLGETIHPNKAERMRAQLFSHPQPKGFQSSVRVLGGWLDRDGGSRTDTKKRVQAAGKVWSKLRRQMPRLRLSVRQKGRLIQAAVASALLYGAEARSFLEIDIRRYKWFLGKIARYCTWKPGMEGQLRRMQGAKTMRDSFKSLGLKSVETLICKRQLAYVGHLARHADDRLEKNMLSVFLVPESLGKKAKRTGKGKG